ncbi:MAG: helix-turn-helix domain-containing protein [Spirochaetes bacterium]|nr:helix-turn-helix domain-containing protein [Spirochaetota bacterium]
MNTQQYNSIVYDAVRRCGAITVGGRTAVILNFLLTEDAPGTRIAQHRHAHCEIGTVTAGEVVYTIGGKRYRVCAGETIIIPPNTAHIRTCPKRCRIYGYWIFAGASFREDVPKVVTVPDAQRFISAVAGEIERCGSGYEYSVAHYLSLLLIDILRQYPEAEKTDAAQSRELSRMRDAVRYINEHIRGDLSSAAISRAVGISSRHLNRLFRHAARVTLHRYIHDTKMLAAYIDLMRDKTVTVREIAGRVGCTDISYFAKCMRAFSGRTPSAIRNS